MKKEVFNCRIYVQKWICHWRQGLLLWQCWEPSQTPGEIPKHMASWWVKLLVLSVLPAPGSRYSLPVLPTAPPAPPGPSSHGAWQGVAPSRGARLLAPAGMSAVLPRTSKACWRELLFIWQLEKDIKTNLLFTASWECNLLAIQSNMAPIYMGLLRWKLAVLGL